MLSKLFYYLTTAAEAGLSVFGLRGVYQQPAYTVRQTLDDAIEVRDYGPRLAVETTEAGTEPRAATNAAFKRLFDYIAGANGGGRTVAMTAPVQQIDGTRDDSRMIAMTAPVQTELGTGSVTMRFFLPDDVTQETAPRPTDDRVRIVALPPVVLAALRFSGPLDDAVRDDRQRQLLHRLAGSAWQPEGAPYVLVYDPPFAIPFLRRNEVAVTVQPR